MDQMYSMVIDRIARRHGCSFAIGFDNTKDTMGLTEIDLYLSWLVQHPEWQTLLCNSSEFCYETWQNVLHTVYLWANTTASFVADEDPKTYNKGVPQLVLGCALRDNGDIEFDVSLIVGNKTDALRFAREWGSEYIYNGTEGAVLVPEEESENERYASIRPADPGYGPGNGRAVVYNCNLKIVNPQ